MSPFILAALISRQRILAQMAMTRAEDAARDPGPVDEFGAEFWRLVAQELELVACCLTDATPDDVVGIGDRLVHVLGLRAQLVV